MTDEIKNIIADKIGDYFDNECSTDKLVEYNNQYNDVTGEGEHVYKMSEFNETLDGNLPSEIADAVTNGNYDSCDDYFIYEYGEINTFDDVTNRIDTGELIDWMIDYDETFGDPNIENIFANATGAMCLITIHGDENDDKYTVSDFRAVYRDSSELFVTKGGDVIKFDEVMDAVEDYDGEFELTKFSVEKYLKDNLTVDTMTVCRHTGLVFGGDYEEGRFFKWFYCPLNGLVLKLFLLNPTSKHIKYISEVPSECCDEYNMYHLIKNIILG